MAWAESFEYILCRSFLGYGLEKCAWYMLYQKTYSSWWLKLEDFVARNGAPWYYVNI